MSKFAYGPATWHMLESSGPERSTLQFYATTYSTTYHGGRQNKSCDQPRQYLARHKGTGYVANFRPAIYYSPKVDSIENPPIRKLLEDNYESHTCKEFVTYRPPHPNDPLPRKVVSCVSGFAHNEAWTFPTEKQVRDVYVDTREAGPIPVYPRHKPILCTYRKTTDPIGHENAGHGPKAMSTECHTQFVRKDIPENYPVSKSGASRKEDTGFTLAQNVEPVTFRPHENHGNELPGYMTWRPTGSSITRKSFVSPAYKTGNEPLQSLTSQASHSNGFVKGSKADADMQLRSYEKVGYTALNQVHPLVQQRVLTKDPVEYTNMTHPHSRCTLTQRHYEGHQRPPPSEPQRLGREEVGHKEKSGFSENNLPLIEPRDRDVARFSTHYQNKFWDPNPKGSTRYGLVANGGGTLPPVEDGYSKSTHIHRRAPPPNQDLNTMDPYTARTELKVDPSYDLTHTHKDHAISVTT